MLTQNLYDDPRMRGDLFKEFQTGSIGTGVAIGDYDGDGRPDIFVVSKTESCRLFRNLGDWRFEDVTERAGVGDEGAAAGIWKQGATFVDVNNDGLLDIYVCRFNAPNLLYINQGDGTFKEMARAYGLDVTDSSVMAAFCDYDRDGWLDVYITTNLLDRVSASQRPARPPLPQQPRRNLHGGYRRARASAARPRVTPPPGGTTTTTAGPIFMWRTTTASPTISTITTGDGTFTDVLNQVMPHIPRSPPWVRTWATWTTTGGSTSSWPTWPRRPTRTTSAPIADAARGPPERRRRSTAAPKYHRNALLLNTGKGRCLEAAFLAGIAATNWTWSARFEDLDNDGRLDLFVTNGFHLEPTGVDLIRADERRHPRPSGSSFMDDSPVQAEAEARVPQPGRAEVRGCERGTGDWTRRASSFGAAFGDLDGDGNLDLVYANYQEGVTRHSQRLRHAATA